ncbi:MAG TPA: methionyl-tRNA formyltransferase [Candidatus Goldiibacteriota bacterium]|nr:methionyl-tRNA formyltransferase [Candidatus Goldiibacteriota bacterium]
MKIAFFGTSDFSVPVLKSVFNSGHKIVVVITQPDKPAGRKQIITPTPVKKIATENNLPVLQPEKVSDKIFIDEYKKYAPDLNLIVSFGQILPDELIYFPKFHSINVHASLLPKYRGASPINHAIINGDKKTGITYQFIEKKLDAGDIIYAVEIPIEKQDTSITLYKKLSELAAATVLKVLNMIETQSYKRIKQDESMTTYVKTLKKEDGKINFNDSSVNIFNKIRGLLPWPCAYCFYDDKMLKIFLSELVEEKFNAAFVTAPVPGQIVKIVKNSGFIVACKNSFLLIKEVQIEGGKKMSAYDFAIGHKDIVDKILK